MSFLFPKAPAAPPPPPAAPQIANPSIIEAAAQDRAALANAEGGGMGGTNLTGGQGTKSPTTTKTLLGA